MRWSRPFVALGVVLGTLGLLGLTEMLLAPPDASVPTTAVGESRDTVVSGHAVCAVGDAREGTSTRLEVVHPGPIGNAPVRVDARRFGDGGDTSLRAPQLFPTTGAVASLEEEGGAQVAGSVSWQDAPLTVARRWRVDDAEDLPTGTAAGPCPVSTAATTWTIPGVSTEGGAEALLRLANPHATGATVAVRFLTPEGPEVPMRLRNLSVGARSTVELSLNEFIPERADVTVIAEVVSGRVAVEGTQLARAAIGDVNGLSLLQAATGAAETWTVPWVTDADGRDPWLWVANDGDRTARVELTVHTPEGGLPAEGLSEVEIPPGTVRRVDLRGVLPEGVSAAITARSDGAPVTVSGGVQIRAAAAAETGLVIQRGAEAAATAWTVTGGPSEGRREQLRLVNPTSEPAVVDVVLWDGRSSELPEELTALEVPAGALLVVHLADLLEGTESWAATVRTRSGAIVAGQVGSGDPAGPAHWVAGIGTPSSAWTTSDTPAIRLVRGTVQRLGTELGIGPFDPFATRSGEPADEPVDVPPEGPNGEPPVDDLGDDGGQPDDAPAPDDTGD